MAEQRLYSTVEESELYRQMKERFGLRDQQTFMQNEHLYLKADSKINQQRIISYQPVASKSHVHHQKSHIHPLDVNTSSGH